MPCLNEERCIATCVQKALEAFRRLGISGEVIVADNGSSDRSREIAEDSGARVILEPRRGYGAALSAGIAVAQGEIVVMADSDDSYDWSRLGEFVTAIKNGHDLVIGNRFRGGIAAGAMPALHRYFGNPILSGLARLLYRIPVGDFHCGMRAFNRQAVAKLALRTPGMEFATEMIVRAAHAGLRITEIPTPLNPDKRDRPPHLRSFRDGWRHLRFMLTYAPDALYFAPALGLLTIGLVGLTTLSAGPVSINGAYFGIHFLALASLLTLLGVNVAGFGIFAKLIYSKALPIKRQSLIGRLLSVFTLERGLVAGAMLVGIGVTADMAILAQWLARNRGELPETIHLAFSASTLVILGINLMFGSFLIRMLLEDCKLE